MEPVVTATFKLSNEITKRLASGEFIRNGGVIREAATGRIVTFLRETGMSTTQISPQALGFLTVGSTASILSLGVSVMGLAVVIQQLNRLEQGLKQAQKLLNKINYKVDLGFYANFRAALDLATQAFTMKNSETRRNMAIQAINRFLEAEHIYTDYVDQELEQGSQITGQYLLTLSLAYLAEARCYLELEEPETALRRFQEGADQIHFRIQKYINLLLTSNPAAYLLPQLKKQIDLTRLTRIYQWIDPTMNENRVFQMQRENLFKMALDPNKWVESLPRAIWDAKIDWSGKAPWDDPKPEIYERLPKALEAMECMIETNNRFEAYQVEVQAIAKLGLNFHEWTQLTPETEEESNESGVMYIIPSTTLKMVVR